MSFMSYNYYRVLLPCNTEKCHRKETLTAYTWDTTVIIIILIMSISLSAAIALQSKVYEDKKFLCTIVS